MDTIKKSKGVKSNVVKRTITFDDYLDCLNKYIEIDREQCNIRSRLHVVRIEKMTKITLSPFDTKRYPIEGSTDTLPWGHYSIPEGAVARKPVRKREGKRKVVGESVHKSEDQSAPDISSSDEQLSKRSRTISEPDDIIILDYVSISLSL